MLVALCAVANGAARPDPSFGNDGIAGISGASNAPFLTPAFGVAKDRQGRLLAVGGTSSGTGNRYVAARFLQDGTPDQSFDGDGLVYVGLTGNLTAATAAGVQRDQRIVLVGQVERFRSSPNNSGCIAVVRLLSDGSLDEGFGGRQPGVQRSCLFRGGGLFAVGQARSLAFAADRRIVVGGTARYGDREGGLVLRYKPNGAVDTTFVGDGRTHFFQRGIVQITPGKGHIGGVSDVRALKQGKVLAGGYFAGRFMLARLDRKGGYDRGFGNHGRTTTDIDGSRRCECSFAEGIARDRQGRTVLAGHAGINHDYVALARYARNGSLDRHFGRRGIVRTHIGTDSTAHRVAILRDGRIVIAGESDGRLIVIRYRADGRLDRSFFGDGVFATQFFGGQTSVAWDLLVDDSNRIVVSGGGPEIGSFLLMRILSN